MDAATVLVRAASSVDGMTGDVIILPVVRVESDGLRAQEDERERMLNGGRPPRRDEVAKAAERARRKKRQEDSQ